MTLYDYKLSRKPDAEDWPFDAIIMAAMRRADSDNLEMLKRCWPHLWQELEARYKAPAGVLCKREAVQDGLDLSMLPADLPE